MTVDDLVFETLFQASLADFVQILACIHPNTP